MNWKLRNYTPLPNDLINEFQLSPLSAKLFSLRGIDTEEKLNFWLNTTLDDLADPSLMHDLDKAVDRINQAIDNGEKITVYGDYDADGITATTIMVEALSVIGAEVDFYIPDRFSDGYGPNMAAYQKLVADGTKLIITVDNGITGVEEIKYAKEHGVDTILTDHHTIQETMPEAYAIVHCNYPGQDYPFDDYCGAGVAYTICRKLMEDSVPELAELAMIGTIGDMVKVTGEGHILVKEGLAYLNQTDRPGLLALIEKAKLNLGSITETDIGFDIAPRLNATGRLANASLAVKLLLETDYEKAQALAQEIENLNNKRKDLTKTTFSESKKQVKHDSKTIVVYDPNIHEGILGLVANKLVKEYHKPTLVLTSDDQGLLKGSGRSPENINLFDTLSSFKDEVFEKFGGHDFACGFSLTSDKLPLLKKAFEDNLVYIEKNNDENFYDLELTADFKIESLQEIAQAGPFGTDNDKPLFSLTNPQFDSFMKIGKDRNHAKMTVFGIDVMAFNHPELNQELLPFIHHMIVTLGTNTYKNQLQLQAIVTDLDYMTPAALNNEPIIDLRQSQSIMGFADQFVVFNEANLEVAKTQLALPNKKIKLIDEVEEGNKVTILDTPKNLAELSLLKQLDYSQIFIRFMLDQLPISAIPNKATFSKLLKYIMLHPNLTLSDYEIASDYLNITANEMRFVLRVFYELGFVTYQDSKIMPVESPEKRELKSSKYLQSVAKQIKFTNTLKSMPLAQLKNYL
ncbi:MAG: single-stranded-DNA-specific exonuclease RecJ [Lactobacillus sp.]|nr:single-stranded-DNA-specific exonuclease RecJ [Lactobacillus sp.]